MPYLKKDFTPMLEHYLVQLGENTKTPARELSAFSWPGRATYKYQSSLDMAYMLKKFPQFILVEKSTVGNSLRCLYSLTPQGATRKGLLGAGRGSSEMAQGPLRTEKTPDRKDVSSMLEHYLPQLKEDIKTPMRDLSPFAPPGTVAKYQYNMDMSYMSRKFPQFIRAEKRAGGPLLYSLTPQGSLRKEMFMGAKKTYKETPAPQTSGLRIVATTPEASLSHMDAHYRTLFRTLQELPKGSEVAVVFYKV